MTRIEITFVLFAVMWCALLAFTVWLAARFGALKMELARGPLISVTREVEDTDPGMVWRCFREGLEAHARKEVGRVLGSMSPPLVQGAAIDAVIAAQDEAAEAEAQPGHVNVEAAERMTSIRLPDHVVDMVLWCPRCNEQHIDAPHGEWTNPPHRSHQCQACSYVWRPADVATNGVAELRTKGKADQLAVPVPRATGEELSLRAVGRQVVQQVDVVFDGPPGPEGGRFVEVENTKGRSVKVGEWGQRVDGFWALRISLLPTKLLTLDSLIDTVADVLQSTSADNRRDQLRQALLEHVGATLTTSKQEG